MITRAEWSFRAACRIDDADALFVQGAAQKDVRRICRGCPVRAECLADALDNRIETGVWGGMTERERRMLLRQHPGVPSWRALIDATLRGVPLSRDPAAAARATAVATGSAQSPPRTG